MILFELVALTLSLILLRLTAVAAAVGCRRVAPLFVFCLYHLDFISNINIFAGSLSDTNNEGGLSAEAGVDSFVTKLDIV